MEISKIAIGKENPQIPLTGSSVKRKRLSDITNTVSSSKFNAQVQDKSKEVCCIVTKESIQQIMEENARLLKALGERNKIIEFTGIELQRLRIMLEKANQQNRSLAQANTQMQSELSLSKERLKALQHELGCTMAVVRSKKSELDEKNKLNKELIDKIRIQSEHSMLVEIATEGRQVGNSMACRLDRDSQLDEENPNNGLCEETKAKATDYNRAEVATGILPLHLVSNIKDCIPKRKTTRRSRALGSTILTAIAKEKPNNEPCETIRSEVEHCKCAEAATDASQSQTADDNMVREPNRKRTTRSESLGTAAASVTHQLEVKEKDTRNRSSRRISNILTTEASESKDYELEVVDAEISACSDTSEPPNKVEVKEKDDTRTRKSLRSKSNTLTNEACKSKDYLLPIVDAEIPVCSVVSDPPNQVEANEKDDTRTLTSFRRSSDTLKSGAGESEDHLPSSADVNKATFSTIIEPPNEEKIEGNGQRDQIATSACEDQGQEVRRTSVGRPMRQAAGKIGSYKEIPLNVKMRRPASLPC